MTSKINSKNYAIETKTLNSLLALGVEKTRESRVSGDVQQKKVVSGETAKSLKILSYSYKKG